MIKMWETNRLRRFVCTRYNTGKCYFIAIFQLRKDIFFIVIFHVKNSASSLCDFCFLNFSINIHSNLKFLRRRNNAC